MENKNSIKNIDTEKEDFAELSIMDNLLLPPVEFGDINEQEIIPEANDLLLDENLRNQDSLDIYIEDALDEYSDEMENEEIQKIANCMNRDESLEYEEYEKKLQVLKKLANPVGKNSFVTLSQAIELEEEIENEFNDKIIDDYFLQDDYPTSDSNDSQEEKKSIIIEPNSQEEVIKTEQKDVTTDEEIIKDLSQFDYGENKIEFNCSQVQSSSPVETNHVIDDEGNKIKLGTSITNNKLTDPDDNVLPDNIEDVPIEMEVAEGQTGEEPSLPSSTDLDTVLPITDTKLTKENTDTINTFSSKYGFKIFKRKCEDKFVQTNKIKLTNTYAQTKYIETANKFVQTIEVNKSEIKEKAIPTTPIKSNNAQTPRKSLKVGLSRKAKYSPLLKN